MDLLRSEVISHFIFQTLAMMATALLIPKVRITSLFGAATAVIALGIINSTFWDMALFFSIPNSLTLHALLLLLANGIIFWTIAKLLPGIEVDSFFAAIAAPVVFTVLSVLFYSYGRSVDWLAVGNYLYLQSLQVRDYFMRTAPTQ
jgi:putative membrane protein